MIYYHLSTNPELTELTPRVPECAVGINEDITTARICFAPTIEGCLSALQTLDGYFYVYCITDEDKTIEIYHPASEEVCDQKITGEVWVLKPVKVTCIGKIHSTDLHEAKEVFVKRYGKYESCHFHKYDWHWCNN